MYRHLIYKLCGWHIYFGPCSSKMVFKNTSKNRKILLAKFRAKQVKSWVKCKICTSILELVGPSVVKL